jgi:hypothetical protein
MHAAILVSLLAAFASAPLLAATGDPLPPLVANRRNLWSLQPLATSPPPESTTTTHPVDAFILDRLQKEGLSPSPPADPRTLVRRLHFILTGLPPSPESVAAFTANPDPHALDVLTDQLLSSRASAEHFSRFWLDLVRYSDSNGFDWDEFRPSSWRFRDYVIRSFLADKPYNQFIREQLAGDELVPNPPADSAQQDALIATGFLRIGPWDNSSKLFNEQHKATAAHMADLTETSASVFLGITMSCCRCHDHKTEPLTHEDHYRFRAHFAGVTPRDDLPIDLAPQQLAIRKHNAPLESSIAAAEKELAALTKKSSRPSKDKDATRKRLEARIASAKASLKPLTFAFIASENPNAEPIRVLRQGDADHPEAPVTHGIPVVVPPPPPTDPAPNRRSALAAWITTPDHPLTARVIVNRLWQLCFNAGLVTTPSDFGHSGSPPSHPELLDWLARDLIAHQWSLRHTLRLLVTSSTWRQSSTDSPNTQSASSRDSSNRLLWRFSPQRLTAEMLRDSLLAVSGTLKPSDGGPPVWPPLPDDVLKANPAFLDDNPEKTKGWYPSAPELQNVRSIYLVQKRSVRLPFMETFDQPDNFSSCERRQTSTAAPQALTLLNSDLATSASTAFAARFSSHKEDTPTAIRAAWQLALQRDPTPQESAIATQFLADHRPDELARVLLNLNEFIYID